MTAATALRRLLADVRSARLPIKCKKSALCQMPACDCCETCWAHEDGPCPDDRQFTMRALGKSTLDYLERLALDGLAGEADNLYVTCRDCQGPLRKDAVSHWCKGIAPKKPTNEGQP